MCVCGHLKENDLGYLIMEARNMLLFYYYTMK